MILARQPKVMRRGKEPPEWIIRFRQWLYGLTLLALILLIVESGLRWALPDALRIAFTVLDLAVFGLFLFDAFLNLYFITPKSRYFREHWHDFLVLVPLAFGFYSIRTQTGVIIVRNVLVLLKTFARTARFSSLLRGVRLNTAQVVVFSFLGTILIGTLLLTFPAATQDGRGTMLIDALFTATSATCVTGLIVQDTPHYFSTFGQMVILCLIQLGGLGIMTYSAFVAILFGRFSLGQRKMVQEMMEEERNIFSTIFFILKMTFIIEGIGALLLFARFYFYFDSAGRAVYFSVFHSISAFCNAGFALFSDSLSRFAADPVVNIVIGSLILLGGIGFIVIWEMTGLIRKQRRQVTLHTRLALATSAVLLLIGFFAVFYFEFDGVLISESLPVKMMAALFHSITARTAGFNTLPIHAFSPITLTILIVLMFIGASPGSTGGGIKTTTFAVLALSVRSIFRGKEQVEIAGKTVPDDSLKRAVVLLVSALSLVLVSFVFLLSVEEKAYTDLLFETVSAFGTVGLSTGVTPALSNTGKMVLTLLMFLGRIGPLTFGLALLREKAKGRIEYPKGRVIIG